VWCGEGDRGVQPLADPSAGLRYPDDPYDRVWIRGSARRTVRNFDDGAGGRDIHGRVRLLRCRLLPCPATPPRASRSRAMLCRTTSSRPRRSRREMTAVAESTRNFLPMRCRICCRARQIRVEDDRICTGEGQTLRRRTAPPPGRGWGRKGREEKGRKRRGEDGAAATAAARGSAGEGARPARSVALRVTQRRCGGSFFMLGAPRTATSPVLPCAPRGRRCYSRLDAEARNSHISRKEEEYEQLDFMKIMTV
jgi:hypothetical protein